MTNGIHETDSDAIVHVSFVDARRVEVFGEAILPGGEFQLDELYQLGERFFVVDEIWATYIDEKGRELDELHDPSEQGATFVAFVTCTLVEGRVSIGDVEQLPGDAFRAGFIEEPEPIVVGDCGACGGQLETIGILGRTAHLRCMNCGLDSTVRATCEGSSR